MTTINLQYMNNIKDIDECINDFIEILKYQTISGIGVLNNSYNDCANWIVSKLNDIGLDEVSILKESVEGKPIVVAKWYGSNPNLSCIFLNSHYDVVPIIEKNWTVEAFNPIRRSDGKIYGRGTQDMKCVCAQYICAIRLLKRSGYRPTRTITLSFVPDEEIGGTDGFGRLVESEWFKQLNIGLGLDEGLASEGDEYAVFYGERMPWWVNVKAIGNTGHASRFIEGTSVEQIISFSNKALKYRQEQKDILHGKCSHTGGCSHSVATKNALTLGDVTTLNLTVLRAGIKAGDKDVLNVVPSDAECSFDIRISPHDDPSQIKNMIDGWCQEINTNTPGTPTGGGLTWNYLVKPMTQHCITSIDENENYFWKLFKDTIDNNFHIPLTTQVFPAATDSRFLRALGIKALGFSPIRKSPILLHEHDEYLHEQVYIEGVEVYIILLTALSSDSNTNV